MSPDQTKQISSWSHLAETPCTSKSLCTYNIRSSEKFLSFYKEIMDAQYFPFYIILSNYVWSILFHQNKDHNVRQIRFHVCIKHRCERRVSKRKTLFGQPDNWRWPGFNVPELLSYLCFLSINHKHIGKDWKLSSAVIL